MYILSCTWNAPVALHAGKPPNAFSGQYSNMIAFSQVLHVFFIQEVNRLAPIKMYWKEGPDGSIFVTSLVLRDCKTGSIRSTYNSVSPTGDFIVDFQSGWLGKGERRLFSICWMGRCKAIRSVPYGMRFVTFGEKT